MSHCRTGGILTICQNKSKHTHLMMLCWSFEDSLDFVCTFDRLWSMSCGGKDTLIFLGLTWGSNLPVPLVAVQVWKWVEKHKITDTPIKTLVAWTLDSILALTLLQFLKALVKAMIIQSYTSSVLPTGGGVCSWGVSWGGFNLGACNQPSIIIPVQVFAELCIKDLQRHQVALIFKKNENQGQQDVFWKQCLNCRKKHIDGKLYNT